MSWKVTRSTLLQWFCIATPCVPGGLARVMMVDDYGNLVAPRDSTNHSLK